MTKASLATVWLDGCSGCHMSFLDMDERLLDIAGRADLVYSPLVDAKEFPPDVDVTLVEGAVSSEDDLGKIKMVRARTRILVSLGDCAVTANVPGMRNPYGPEPLLQRAYIENVTLNPSCPARSCPSCWPQSRPVHKSSRSTCSCRAAPRPPTRSSSWSTSCSQGRVPDTATISRFGA